MSTASELLVSTGDGDLPQGSPSQLAEAGVTSSNSEGAISQGSPVPSGGWTDAVADLELREFIANKGWKDPG
jgi:hypothetical protein